MPCRHLASPALEKPAACCGGAGQAVVYIMRGLETLKTLKQASSVRLESSELGVDFVLLADGLMSRVFA